MWANLKLIACVPSIFAGNKGKCQGEKHRTKTHKVYVPSCPSSPFPEFIFPCQYGRLTSWHACFISRSWRGLLSQPYLNWLKFTNINRRTLMRWVLDSRLIFFLLFLVHCGATVQLWARFPEYLACSANGPWVRKWWMRTKQRENV